MKKVFLVYLSLLISVGSMFPKPANQIQSIQQNNQQVNINVPVIEKKVYVDRYRTVYVDRPQPKRVPKKLTKPICLHNYLWVYTEDIGDFKNISDALEIVKNINSSTPYNRIWRIPTSAELAVLEQNADVVGLGEGIYLATDHRNGILRMVASGPTASELKAQEAAANAERHRKQLEEERIEQERRNREAALLAEERAKKEAEQKRIAEEQRKKTLYENNPILAAKELCGLDIIVQQRSYNNFRSCPTGYHVATKHEMELLTSKLSPSIQKNLVKRYRLNDVNDTYIVTSGTSIISGESGKSSIPGRGVYSYNLSNCYCVNDYNSGIFRPLNGGRVSYNLYNSKKIAEQQGPNHVKTISRLITIYVKN